jgi:hypothetical protein
MTLDEFTPLVGSTFIADCEPAPVGIKLIEASPLRNNAKLERPPFVLIFCSPPAVSLIEGGYVLRCGEWGPAAIHMGPIIPPASGMAGHHYYQAIFN